MYCTSIFTGMTHIALSETTCSEAERKQVEKKKKADKSKIYIADF